MRAIVRETLYRDIIGFIPVYSLVFAFGLWFGAFQLGWAWLQNLWLAVPLTAAIADYVEDICHLRCLRRHERDKRPTLFLTWFCAAMTSVKLVAFGAEALLTFVDRDRGDVADRPGARPLRLARHAGRGRLDHCARPSRPAWASGRSSTGSRRRRPRTVM